jgi:hypothetical protein
VIVYVDASWHDWKDGDTVRLSPHVGVGIVVIENGRRFTASLRLPREIGENPEQTAVDFVRSGFRRATIYNDNPTILRATYSPSRPFHAFPELHDAHRLAQVAHQGPYFHGKAFQPPEIPNETN